MRLGPTTEALAGAVGWVPQVAAWKGGIVTALSVPVMSGRITADVSQNVPERLTLRVPRQSTVDGRLFDWLPGVDVAHPLARYGQYLSVAIAVTSSMSGTVWTTKVGTYRIQSWAEQADGTVQVEAVGFLQRIAGDRLRTPLAPLSTGTLTSEFRRLLPSGFSVSIDSTLTNRACPQTLSWADDRLAALYSIADAWPARLRTSEDGWRLQLLPALASTPGTPVLSVTDGARGTVVTAPASDTRDKAYNVVVARSSATSDPNSPPLQAVAEQTSGSMAASGDYGPETMFWSTPLATTIPQLQASANTMLANNLRPSRVLQVTMASDPRVDLDDALQVTYRGRTVIGWVLSYDLPLTVGDGDMRVTVGIGA